MPLPALVEALGILTLAMGTTVLLLGLGQAVWRWWGRRRDWRA